MLNARETHASVCVMGMQTSGGPNV
jgi:hypothetical protein